MTSHSRRIPAISKSEFVIHPVGLVLEWMFDVMSKGHCQRKTVGMHSARSPMTTPPTLWLEASTILTKSGHPVKSSLHRVGSFVDSQRRVQQPLMLANNFLCRVNHTIVGFFARNRLKGDSSPTPTGIAVNACLSYAAIVSNCLNGMAPVPRNAV
jgi:hypothetical protein